MVSLHCSGDFRGCALGWYICLKGSGRAKGGGERVGRTRSLMLGKLDVRRLQTVGVFVFLLLEQEYARGEGRHTRTRMDTCDEHGRIEGGIYIYS